MVSHTSVASGIDGRVTVVAVREIGDVSVGLIALNLCDIEISEGVVVCIDVPCGHGAGQCAVVVIVNQAITVVVDGVAGLVGVWIDGAFKVVAVIGIVDMALWLGAGIGGCFSISKAISICVFVPCEGVYV